MSTASASRGGSAGTCTERLRGARGRDETRPGSHSWRLPGDADVNTRLRARQIELDRFNLLWLVVWPWVARQGSLVAAVRSFLRAGACATCGLMAKSESICCMRA